MRKIWICLLLLSCLQVQADELPAKANDVDRAATADRAALIQQVNQLVDSWHDDAAHARFAYFDKMTADAVYIGTDPGERWTRDEFRVWAQPFFARGAAWTFHVLNRHVAMSSDQSVLWFDEQLQTEMGICQASGVVQKTQQGLKIAHYQLSLAIPNALIPYVKDGVKQLATKASSSAK